MMDKEIDKILKDIKLDINTLRVHIDIKSEINSFEKQVIELNAKLDLIKGLYHKTGEPSIKLKKIGEATDDQLKTPIDRLELNTRAYNCLRNSGIETVGGIIDFGELNILKLRGVNKKTSSIITDSLIDIGIDKEYLQKKYLFRKIRK